MAHANYNSMIAEIAEKLSQDKPVNKEDLETEMNVALCSLIGEVDDDCMSKIFVEVVEAYLRGYVGCVGIERLKKRISREMEPLHVKEGDGDYIDAYNNVLEWLEDV